MKKKILVLAAISVICLLTFDSVKAYDELQIATDEVVWSTEKQRWQNGWDICCDKSDPDAPCRQSTSNC